MIDLAWSRSMQLVRAPHALRLDRVIVVGPSGAGKSTLVAAVRDADLPGVVVPLRYVTRPARVSDQGETLHASSEQFDSHVGDGSLEIHWRRSFAGGRIVRYGFAAARPGTLAVLSANSAILDPDAQLTPSTALERALVVGVTAPHSVREARLVRRSPELDRVEIAYRLSHDEPSDVHVTIDNHGDLEPVARTELVQLVERLAREAR